MGRITAQGQSRQIVCETPSPHTRAKWTGSVAQVLEHLLCKHEALRSHPSRTRLRPLSICLLSLSFKGQGQAGGGGVSFLLKYNSWWYGGMQRTGMSGHGNLSPSPLQCDFLQPQAFVWKGEGKANDDIIGFGEPSMREEIGKLCVNQELQAGAGVGRCSFAHALFTFKKFTFKFRCALRCAVPLACVVT
jgi:hypothetical protein